MNGGSSKQFPFISSWNRFTALFLGLYQPHWVVNTHTHKPYVCMHTANIYLMICQNLTWVFRSIINTVFDYVCIFLCVHNLWWLHDAIHIVKEQKCSLFLWWSIQTIHKSFIFYLTCEWKHEITMKPEI